MNESFVFYKSYHEAIQCLPEELQLDAYKAICEYAITGIEPEGCNTIVKAIFKMAKPTVNSNLARKENGKLGGAPKGNQNARKQPKQPMVDNEKQPKNNHRLFLKQPNENETVNENETPPYVPPDVDNSVKKEGKAGKVYIGQDYHVAWDEHFTEELRPLSESQIGEIDYWLKSKFGFQEIPIHLIRSALITKAKRETGQNASNF